jgi:hypothetical protein
MTNIKYIGMDVHMESISVCVRNSVTASAFHWMATARVRTRASSTPSASTERD